MQYQNIGMHHLECFYLPWHYEGFQHSTVFVKIQIQQPLAELFTAAINLGVDDNKKHSIS